MPFRGPASALRDTRHPSVRSPVNQEAMEQTVYWTASVRMEPAVTLRMELVFVQKGTRDLSEYAHIF